jgi:hypothetical protein
VRFLAGEAQLDAFLELVEPNDEALLAAATGVQMPVPAALAIITITAWAQQARTSIARATFLAASSNLAQPGIR